MIHDTIMVIRKNNTMVKVGTERLRMVHQTISKNRY